MGATGAIWPVRPPLHCKPNPNCCSKTSFLPLLCRSLLLRWISPSQRVSLCYPEFRICNSEAKASMWIHNYQYEENITFNYWMKLLTKFYAPLTCEPRSARPRAPASSTRIERGKKRTSTPAKPLRTSTHTNYTRVFHNSLRVFPPLPF